MAEIKMENDRWLAKTNEERIARGETPGEYKEPPNQELPTVIANNPILHYLPPSWTEEIYENPSDADYEGLTDEV